MANISDQTSSHSCFHLKDDFHNTDYFRTTFIVCCVLNAIFALSATVSNAVIIIGIKRTPSLHTPSNVLFCGLAACGLGIGVFTQPSYVVYKVAELMRDVETICWIRTVHHICTHLFSKLLLFILTEISVERFLGLHLLQKYRTVVSSKRAAIALATAVAAAALIAASIAVWKYNLPSNVLSFILMLSCVLITTVSYLNVYGKLKRQTRIRNRNLLLRDSSSESEHDISIYKHSILTVAWLIGSVLFCSIPQLCLLVVQAVLGYTDPVRLAQNVAATILFMNATLNPFVWFYRNKRIRQAAWKALGIFNSNSENLELDVRV